MPYTFPNGSSYVLVYLDTNALSDISKNINGSFNQFIENFPPEKYVSCFSAYSIFELHRAENAYNAFIKVFSHYGIMLLPPYTNIVEEEVRVYGTCESPDIVFEFFPHTGKYEKNNLQARLEEIWNNMDKDQIEYTEKIQYPQFVQEWNENREDKQGKYTRSDEEVIVRHLLTGLHKEWVDKNQNFSVNSFPSLRMINLSYLYRLNDGNRKFEESDVNDVMMSSAMPYVDVIITEKYQTEVIRQAKRLIPEVGRIIFYRLSELYRQ